MPAPRIRSDYGALQQVAQTFSRQAEAAERTLQAIRRQKDILEGGDWVGQGATAFYHEMNGSVIPTLTRLTRALEHAAQVTGQISAAMKQAEEEAARVLRGDGAGVTRPGNVISGTLVAAAGSVTSPSVSSFQSFSTFGAAQAGGAETNLIDDDERARWQTWADQNQKQYEELKQQEKAQLEKDNVEILKGIDEHLKAGMPDPFPNLTGDEHDKALDALNAYQNILFERPDYDKKYDMMNILMNEARVAEDEEHHLYLAFNDPKKMREVLEKSYGEHLAEQIGDAVPDAVRDKLLKKALNKDFGERTAEELMEPVDVGIAVLQSFEVLEDVKQEGLVSGFSAEAKEWQSKKKLSLVLDNIAKSTGRDKADLLDQYQKFEKISDEYHRYQFLNERLNHPDGRPHESAWPAP